MDAQFLYGIDRGCLDRVVAGQAQIILRTVIGAVKLAAAAIQHRTDGQRRGLQCLVVYPRAIVASTRLPIVVVTKPLAEVDSLKFSKIGE